MPNRCIISIEISQITHIKPRGTTIVDENYLILHGPQPNITTRAD